MEVEQRIQSHKPFEAGGVWYWHLTSAIPCTGYPTAEAAFESAYVALEQARGSFSEDEYRRFKQGLEAGERELGLRE